MARKKQIVQFEQNEKLFKTLIENSWDVIVLVDAKGRAIYSSPSSVRMFGRDYQEFIGLNNLKYLHPLDTPKVVKGLAQIIRSPHKPIHMEMRIKHKLGHYVWIEAIATNYLADKNIKGIVVNFHDITALKENEERKDEFISVTSHELKLPITSLKIYLQILNNKKGNLSPSKKDEFLQKMSDQLGRMERFVNDLYDATKIREGKVALKKEKFKIMTLLKETVEDIERNYGTHRVFINSQFNGSIVADRTRIQQVLINILVNAIKFSPQANKIKIKVWKKEKDVYISITDYGLGISKENIKKITERFYQAETKNKSITGLGLGLYIAYNIIKQHKGDFLVKSRQGKSTTITICIPQK